MGSRHIKASDRHGRLAGRYSAHRIMFRRHEGGATPGPAVRRRAQHLARASRADAEEILVGALPSVLPPPSSG
jgi:hypothetical protein